MPKKAAKLEPTTDGKPNRKPRRYKPGTVARRKIRYYQEGKGATKKLIRKEPFKRLVREVLGEVCDQMIRDQTRKFGDDDRIERVSVTGMEALQECGEAYAVQLFNETQKNVEFRNAKTIQVKDFKKAVERFPVRTYTS